MREAEMIKGILFDMDGVLVDSEPTITSASVLALKEYGIEAKEEEFKAFTGMGEDNFIGGVARLHGATYVTEMKTRAYDIYDTIVEKTIGLYKEVPETIAYLKSKGYKVCVCSAADLRKVKSNLLAAKIPFELFDGILSGDDVQNKKPAPDIFLKGAEKLGLSPSECIVVEDALSGIEAGKRAGAKVCAVTTSFSRETLSKLQLYAVMEGIFELKEIL